ncbi:MAG: hypothetical protein AVDCRST_MAG78-528 [uncultured Rubrobacteraceae bacterium]|uniref:Uncharacterized protein n=1 Tax=uncultured Rubrobacteraceae bacterium TaxID=349277 RepID=A0A6J4PG64_9ACTN|nr:MAG: hypothetical protein AVDCRST_MAG78-528 [uncultured Rubrobacteraceae bacterium]
MTGAESPAPDLTSCALALYTRTPSRICWGVVGREGFLDPIIFVLIFFTLLAMGTGRCWLVLTLYFASLAATLLLFNYHVTSRLDLNF